MIINRMSAGFVVVVVVVVVVLMKICDRDSKV